MPPTLVVDGFLISDRGLVDVALAVELALQLHMSNSWIIDSSTWVDVLGDTEYVIQNPDPVPDLDGSVLIPVGEVSVAPADVPAFVGRLVPEADPLSIIVRQELWWEALMAEPPAPNSGGAFGDLLAQVGSGPYAVRVVPYLVDDAGVVTIDPEPAEQLVRDFVPFPAGPELGSRLMVSVLTRSRSVDPAELAVAVANAGAEIVDIGNAAEFDEAPSQLFAPVVLQDEGAPLHEALFTLADEFGAAIVWTEEFDDADVVTLVAGPDIRVES